MFGNYPYYPPTALIPPIWSINASIIQDIATCSEVLEKYNSFICIQYDSSIHITPMYNSSNIDIMFRGNKCISITEFSIDGIVTHEIKPDTKDLKNDLSCLLEKIYRNENSDK